MNLPVAGTRIRLIHTDDPYTRLTPGELGTVTRVGLRPESHLDVQWDSGSTLRLLPDEGDRWNEVSDE